MALAYQNLMLENIDYGKIIKELPSMMYSGKVGKKNASGVFFCYQLPMKDDQSEWTNANGVCHWYYVNSDGTVTDGMYDIWKSIESPKNTPRVLMINAAEFKEVRKKVEAHIRKTYLRMVQAPIGVNPRLVTWMQIG